MDRLQSLRVFREVVESGGFAAAARRLSISAPMASKHLAQLERSVGARLLHRTSRHLSLTEAGTAYYRQCCEAIDLLDAADAQIGRDAGGARGQLKVSAPVWFANADFGRALVEYRERCPEVMRSDDTTLTCHAVRAGTGVAFLPECVVAAELREGRLARVLPRDTPLPSTTLHAVYTSRQYMAPKLRSFIDFLCEALAR